MRLSRLILDKKPCNTASSNLPEKFCIHTCWLNVFYTSSIVRRKPYTSIAIYILLAVFCLSFLLVQKRNKKRPPIAFPLKCGTSCSSQRNCPFSESVFQFSLCITVVNYSGPLIASPLPALEAQIGSNK